MTVAAKWRPPRSIANEPEPYEPMGEPLNGHVHPDPQAADLHLDTLRARLLTPQQLDQLPPPEPLIDGVLVRNTLAALYGKPGSGKSFIAMDWALSVATGTWWAKRQIYRGPVVYIAAEGAAGLPQRKQAWEAGRHVIVRDHIHWLPLAINLLDQQWADALVALITEMQPVLVVIDTVARSMVGGDENAAKDMGRLVDNADRVRRASGATVNLVHHSPKAGGDLRGHSSLEGAVDTAIEVTADGELVTVKVTKQKDMAKIEPIRLQLVPTGMSAFLNCHGPMAVGDELFASEATVLEAVMAAAGSDGLSTTRILAIDGLPERSHYRAMKTLVSRGLVRNVGTARQPRYTAEPISQQENCQ